MHRWFEANWTLLTNTASLISTTGVTSALGFVFWWLAARLFPPAAMGLGSAAISAMMLLGTVGMLGLGTWLIGELPHQRSRPGSLITTALCVAGVMSGALGILFLIIVSHLSAEFKSLAHDPNSITFFVLGVTATGVVLVLDQALIGLLHGGLQLWRNAIFAVVKLGALLVAGIWFVEKSALTIYVAWLVGNLISLGVLTGILALKGVSPSGFIPRLTIMRGLLGRGILGHHVLNLSLEAPGWALPIIVTALLSSTVNAGFFVAWMIAQLTFIVPGHFTTVLYAVGAKDPAALDEKLRLTLKLSFVISLLTSSVIVVGAHQILRLFGIYYAEQAEWCLRVLGLTVFPLILKQHYVAIRRVQGKIGGAALTMAIAGIFELIFAAIGANLGGLTGLSIGWLVIVCLEALFMAPTVYRTASSKTIIYARF